MRTRIFKVRAFDRWAAEEGLSDDVLTFAGKEALNGLTDARLGANVFKKRISQPGRGKSGGWRTIIVFKASGRLFYVYGFAKKERANIGLAELKALRRLAKELMQYSEEQLAVALKHGELVEVTGNEKLDS